MIFQIYKETEQSKLNYQTRIFKEGVLLLESICHDKHGLNGLGCVGRVSHSTLVNRVDDRLSPPDMTLN